MGCSDVHEHGKVLIEHVLSGLGIECIDGGVSADADDLVASAIGSGANVIAISTYNGIALHYAQEVQAALSKVGSAIPVFIGGRLNQIQDDSNSGLPVDVSLDIAALGISACASPGEFIAALGNLERERQADLCTLRHSVGHVLGGSSA